MYSNILMCIDISKKLPLFAGIPTSNQNFVTTRDKFESLKRNIVNTKQTFPLPKTNKPSLAIFLFSGTYYPYLYPHLRTLRVSVVVVFRF